MKLVKWFYMLNKRLYKKAAFIVILALLLASVIAFTASSKSESGFIRVALAQTDKSDRVSSEIVKGLKSTDSMILFAETETPEEAVEAVKSGDADSAWIFPEDMGSDFESITTEGAIKVVERKQSVFSRLAREKLNAEVFKHTAKAYCLYYADENLPELDNVSDEELLNFYENTIIDSSLFVLDNPVSSSNQGENDYLTAPLRGLLAIITVLGGMAGVLYYMKDEERNLFANIQVKKKPLIAFASVCVATLNVSVISMVALISSGLYKFSITEVIAAVLYAAASAAFCMLLLSIFKSIKAFGAVIPALVTVISVVCPVFFYLKELKKLAWLFPPTYYINASVNSMYLLYMLLYTVACLVLAYLIAKLQKRA